MLVCGNHYPTTAFRNAEKGLIFLKHLRGLKVTKSRNNLPQKEPTLSIRGVNFWDSWLSKSRQFQILKDLRAIVAKAPLFKPVIPGGKKMSVRITSARDLGWVADSSGYRYEPKHPDGINWPPIPQSVLEVWEILSGSSRKPDCCLLNFYQAGARMCMHQDLDEANLTEPVISISLGDDALFRIGSPTKGGKTDSILLRSGDVIRLGEEARLIYHGIDRINSGSSTLLKNGGRINLTLRVVT